MRAPVSWLREYVDLPAEVSTAQLADRLTMLGLKLEAIDLAGADVVGPLVVGRVLEFEEEQHSNGRTVRWCQVDVGEPQPRGVVCGARNFAAGDLVVVSLPGAVLPGGTISARKTYGHVSDGMICSARELGLGEDQSGILVLTGSPGAPGDDAGSLLGVRDDVLEFEINADRAYALSMRGVAREAATAYRLPFTDPGLTLPATEVGAGYPVRVDDPAGCDSFVALEVTGVDAAAPTPPWLARRVQLAGMRPISLPVDVTNYVMLELGQPIHGYDKAALRGPIVVRRAGLGETLRTLDEVVRELDPEDLLITDDSGPIGLAGVMGGASTELSGSTTDVVVEAARFDPVTVARTVRRHRLPSEASKRFERGIDPTLAAVAARRVADLLVAHGGGRVAATASAVGRPAGRETIRLTSALAARVSGVDIGAEAAVMSLETVGCLVERTDPLAVIPPPWRPDLRDPHDLVEEVLRVVGYDSIPSVLPQAPAGRGLTTRQRLRRRVGVSLATAGYVETLSYPFLSVEDWSRLQLDENDPRRRAVGITNPWSDEQPLMRTTLLPGLFTVLARNAGRGQADLGLFEAGRVFAVHPDGRPDAPVLGVTSAPSLDELKQLEATLPDQPHHLGLVASGERDRSGWWGAGRVVSWVDAVEACRGVAEAVGVDLQVVTSQLAPWHLGRCAELLVGATVVGYAGELHPQVCRSYGIPGRTVAAEIDLDVLLSHASTLVRSRRLSTYPVAKTDVALVVDAEVPAADVEAALREGAGDLLESLRLFDVYTGSPVPSGHKSLAYSLRFRATDHTLTDEEIKDASAAAVEQAAVQTGAELRS